jgi:ribonuclease BN (tRNA processing enzyme)
MPNSLNILIFLFFISIFNSASTANESCAHIRLQVLGEGGPEINDGLASSSYLVWVNNKARVLVDAGGGSSLNFEKSGANFNDLQAILLTHLHVDHSAALPVYLKGSFFTGRKTALPLYGPAAGGSFPSTEGFAAALVSNHQASSYPYLSDTLHQQASTDFSIVPESIKTEDSIWQKNISKNLSISSISVKHGAIPALAWRVEYNHCSITFSGDMNGSSGRLPTLARDTNILVANNAIPEQAGSVARNLHMTPRIIGQIAQQAKVKKLLLSHFMLRTINIIGKTKRLIRQSYQGEIIKANALMFIDL